MAKRKVIEDSDGEDDESESPPPAASILADLSLSNLVDMPSSPTAIDSQVSQPIDPSTSSTEVLKREIQHAHKSLMDPTTDGTKPSTEPLSFSQQLPASLRMSKPKRKRSLSNVESPGSRVKKTAKMKTLSKDRDPFEFRGSSDSEIGITLKGGGSKRRTGWPQKGASKNTTGAIEMPPPSTKPASGEQSKSSGSTMSTITDPAHARFMLSNGTPARSERNETMRSFETPILDVRMPTPTVSSRGRGNNGKVYHEEQTPNDLHSSAIAALQMLPTSDPRQEPSSSASLVSPSKTITVEKVNIRTTQLQDEDLEDELSKPLPTFHAAGNINPIVLLPQRAQSPERPDQTTYDTQSGSDDDLQPDKSRKLKESPEKVADDLGSDDVGKELSNERYLPRPSRSRAGRGAGELVAPVDFSKKPEAVAKAVVKPKRKNNRSKISASQELGQPEHESEDEEDDPASRNEILEIPNGRDRSPNQQPDDPARDENGAHIEESAAPETGNVTRKPTKKRGRPKKANPVEESKSAIEAAEENKGAGLTKEEPKHVKMAQKTRKKDRVVELVPEETGDNDSRIDSEEEPLIACPAAIGDKVLEESTGNAAKLQGLEDATKQASLPEESLALPETPKRPAKAPEKGPDKHSPISSGKVAYRVGLSKRARIEPLLRIVRK